MKLNYERVFRHNIQEETSSRQNGVQRLPKLVFEKTKFVLVSNKLLSADVSDIQKLMENQRQKEFVIKT